MTRKQRRTAGQKKSDRNGPSKKTAKGTARAKKEASRRSNTVAAEKRSRASRATSDGQTEPGFAHPSHAKRAPPPFSPRGLIFLVGGCSRSRLFTRQ